MDEAGRIVRNAYDSLASRFDAWAEIQRVHERREYLETISRALPPGSTILDIGCGNGLLEAKRLAELYAVIGVDISERQIREARKNVKKGTFICQDIRDCAFPDASFDGIVSFYCFNHIPRESYASLLLKMKRWLRRNGVVIASFGIGDCEGWTGEWLGEQVFFSSDTHGRITSLFKSSGFNVKEAVIKTDFEDGMEVSFLWIVAEKE